MMPLVNFLTIKTNSYKCNFNQIVSLHQRLHLLQMAIFVHEVMELSDKAV